MELKRNSIGLDIAEVKTAHGKLVIYESDSAFPGVYVDYIPNDMDEPGIPVASIEDIPKSSETPESISGVVTVRIWGSPWHDDYTNRVDIPIKDIKEALEHDKG